MADLHHILVFSNPVPGREREYNDWYNAQHMPDALRCPGFVSGRRYEIADPDVAAKLPARYVAIYEVETDDPARTLSEAMSRIGTPEMPISDAMDLNSGVPVVLRAVSDVIRRK